MTSYAIAHNEVMVIDSATILTGSFNFTKAAEEKNAENLLVIKDAPELVQVYAANVRAQAAQAHLYTQQASRTPPATEAASKAGRKRGRNPLISRMENTGFEPVTSALQGRG
jgi:phosphatidylserine/phosphatidylglycerophosphate/cardiolipin synthase-like enzyme